MANAVKTYNGGNAFTLKPNGMDTRTVNKLLYAPNQIPQQGLLLSYDPAHPSSYPGTGVYLYDLTNNDNDSILVGGLETNYRPEGWFSGDGVNDAVDSTQTFTLSGTKVAIGCWFRLDGDLNGSFTQFNQLISPLSGGSLGFSMRWDGVNQQVVSRFGDGAGAGSNLRSQNVNQNTWYYAFAQLDTDSDVQEAYLFDGTGLIQVQTRTNSACDLVANPLTGFYAYVSRSSYPRQFSVGESHLYNDAFFVQGRIESIYENTKARYGY